MAEKNNRTTKAGLMNKNANEVEPVEPEDAETIDANENEDSINEKLPRAGKHESEGSRKSEGLH